MSKENKAQQDNQSKTQIKKPSQIEMPSLETAVFQPQPILQRAYLNPHNLTPTDAQTLQRSIGNQTVRRLSIQRKMTLGPIGDKYEQEADAVAKQVVGKINTSAPQTNSAQTTQRQEEDEEVQMKPLPTISTLQRQEDEEEIQMFADSSLQRHAEEETQMSPLVQRHEEEVQMMPLTQRQEEEEEVQMMPFSSSLQRQEEEEEIQMVPLVQRHEEEVQMMPLAQRQEEEEEVQMHAATNSAQGGEITSEIEQSIQNGRSGGQPLSDPIRQPMEHAFNADFSSVRVHTDSNSDAINRSISARAFTTGQDIFFRSGEYNPGSSNGQELLAHELTHTVQQGAAPQKTSIQAKRSEPKAKVKEKSPTTKIQRRDDQHSLAKIVNAGVSASDSRGNMGQLGHAMDVWVEIDAGAHPTTPANAKPNTVYGLEFEYWEYVDVPHDNQGATGIKPWNDIHGMKPDASTFDVAAPGCDLTWKQAVSQAAAGTLTGKKKIGFRDLPGLFEKANRNVERTLKFRIVFFDGNERKEIFATQLLRVNNGKLGYSAYTDSMGNKIESHGFGGDAYEKGSDQEQLALSQEGGRLDMDGSALPSNAAIKATIPMEARSGVQTFVKNIVDGNTDPYVDKEMAEFVSKVSADKQESQAPNDWVNMISKEFMTDKPGVAAGQYLIPNIPSTLRVQKALPSGGLLVAIVTGNNILRMYYTDNSVQNVSMNIVPQLARKNWTINLRSFTEIPTKMFQNSLSIYKSISINTTLKKMTLNAGNAHLRKFEQQGKNFIVKVGSSTGSKIKTNNEVSVFDPEIRDITGAWLKAQFSGKTGFIRANKLNGTKDAADWNRQQKGDLTALRPDQSMEVNDADQLKQLAQTNAGNHLALLTAILTYMRRFQGRAGSIEKVYNSEIPGLGLNVPNTLGELANNHFISVFENLGNGAGVYRNLMQQFPEFQYLVKPAYRLTFGEAQLGRLLRQMRDEDFAQDIPNPDSLENSLAELQFLTSGPYRLTDFVPSTGIGKFDIEYEPLTDDLRIIVKVNFEFVDFSQGYDSVTVPDKPLDANYLKKQWDNTAKQPWIQEFKDQINRIWDGKFAIHCIRPGWNLVKAVPKMEVKEVPDGQQHFKVKVDKAALVDDHGQQKMRTNQGSSYVDSTKSVTQLREFDLVDKISDPSVHEYLHAGEKRGNITPAYKLDRERLENLLNQFGRLSYQQNSTNLENPRIVMNLIDAIKRTEIPSTLAHLHPIVIEKNAVRVQNGRANWRLAALRARQIEQQLQTAGIRNPIQVTAGSENLNGLIIKGAPLDPVIENTYVQNWQRISAAHEFGHMIGLVDEYNPAASSDMVKKMISDGLLPPQTPGNHLSGAGKSKEGGQGSKQAAYAQLLNDTNLSAPDFTYDKSTPMSTSIMTGGFEVMAQHYVTFWEALTQMTATHVDKKYWEIR